MKVLVLGAGASHGASDWSITRPPLVDQFFVAALRLGLLDPAFSDGAMDALRSEIESEGGSWGAIESFFGGRSLSGHLHALKAFVAEQLDVSSDEYDSKPINIERLFGLIEAELLGRIGFDSLVGNRPAHSPADTLEQQLYLIVCGTLVPSTKGVLCGHHDRVAAWLDPGDVVISFNYDLLADRALAQRGDWWINDGYGLDFHRVGRWSGDRGEWRKPLDTRSRVLLLKPHGSLNWLFCRDPRETHLHASLRGAKARQPPEVLYCLEDMHEDFQTDFPLFEWWARYEHDDEEGYSYDLHSLIVPPAITKPYRDYERLIGGTWSRALQSLLQHAEQLYFVGYSMRPEDLRSWWLFRKAAADAQRLRQVFAVDPSPDVEKRVTSVFTNHSVEVAAPTLADFVGSI